MLRSLPRFESAFPLSAERQTVCISASTLRFSPRSIVWLRTVLALLNPVIQVVITSLSLAMAEALKRTSQIKNSETVPKPTQ